MIGLLRALRRLRCERGSSAVEVAGFMPLLMLAAFAGWQILLVAFTATAAENAARTASRAESKGESGQEAALDSVSSWLRDGTKAKIDGTKTTVTISVPIVVPLFSTDALSVSGEAEMPETES